MKQDQSILFAFYGDDFTGSTDALEFISRAGAKAMLFIEPPTAEQLNRYPELNVIGVAGATRSMPPDEMGKELRSAFTQLKATGAKHIHYKVCSTFDSSPTTGSIGKAMDTGKEVFGTAVIPIIGGMPALGRYCVFGNLFARMGTGSNGQIHRLDRHPSMRFHPVTPADESDLILHLQKQTAKKGSLIDILHQEKPLDEWMDHIDPSHEFVLLDALYEHHLIKTGQWLEALSDKQYPLFSIGSSAVEMALGHQWNSKKKIGAVTQWPEPGIADAMLVISGSCSPVTAAQIKWAADNGFTVVELDAKAIAEDRSDTSSITNDIISALQNKQHVILHTGTKQSSGISSQKLGTALGLVAKAAAEANIARRIVIAGGDTSSYAARAMEIEAVEMIAPLVSGAPLCKAFSSNRSVNGLQVNFKGGQVGPENYFGICINGKK